MTSRLAPFGVVALGAGLFVVFEPASAPAFAESYVFVTILGGLAVVQGLRVGIRRRRASLRRAMPPDPELPIRVSTPGDEFDDRLASLARPTWYVRTDRSQLRDELRETAIAVLTSHTGYSQAEAIARLDRGTWTDDPFAATFLGDEGVPGPSWKRRLPAALARESQFHRQVRHTVSALVQVTEGGA